MTALTREAIVEAAARAQYLDDRTRGGEGPFEWPEWEYLPDFERAICRESALVTVLATLRALEPVSDAFEGLAAVNEALVDDEPDADHGTTMKRYGHIIAYRDAAAILRKVWAL